MVKDSPSIISVILPDDDRCRTVHTHHWWLWTASTIREAKRTAATPSAVTADADHWLRAFMADPVQAREDLKVAPIVAPPSGRVTGGPHPNLGRVDRDGPDRRTVINVSRIEWDQAPGLHKLVGKADYINGELRQAGYTALTKDEAEVIAAVAQY